MRRTASTGSDSRGDVVAEDVLELDRLGRRRDVLGVELGQDHVLVEDVVELALEARQLLVGQAEAGEVGDVLDVGSGERGHGPMIAEAPIGPTRYRERMAQTTATARIRPMLAADVAQATQVILDGGWSDRSVFFEWAITHPTCFPLVAEADGRVVGTGVATVNGRVGWVGAIFVAEDRRRSGLGTALSRAVVEELERQGCVTQVLIATDEGRPIYERLGFAVHARYVLETAPDAPPAPDDGSGPAVRRRRLRRDRRPRPAGDRRGPIGDPAGVRLARDGAGRAARRRRRSAAS